MASALATVCLLNGSSSQDALTHFLQQRTHSLAAFAASPPEPTAATPSATADTGRAPGDSSHLITQACTMAAMVQDALFHAVLLFMDGDPLDVSAGMLAGTPRHNGHKTAPLGTWKNGAVADWNGVGGGPGGALEPGPMIMRALVADSHASAELLFDALPGAPEGDSEAEAWDAALKHQLQSMPPLPAEDVRRTCAAWLHDLPAATPGLLSAAASCADLAAVSEAVRAALPRWTPRGGAAATAVAATGGSGDAATHWPAVASTALGRTADVWSAVFEPCALRCAGTIVGAAVRRGAAAAQEHLGACRAAAAAAAAAAGAQSDAPGGCTAAAEWSSGAGAAPWRAALPEARVLLDTAVRGTLADAMALLARGEGGFSRAQAEARRAETLEQHVHTAVVEGAQSLAGELSALQSALPQDGHSRHVPHPVAPYPLRLFCFMLV